MNAQTHCPWYWPLTRRASWRERLIALAIFGQMLLFLAGFALLSHWLGD